MSSYNEVTPKKLGKKKPRERKKEPKVKSPQTNDSNDNEAKWPQSLSDFVNKLFARVKTLSPEIQTVFASQMQTLMERAITQNKVWTNPWELQLLPVFDPACPLDLYENVFARPSIMDQTTVSTEQQSPTKATDGVQDVNDVRNDGVGMLSKSFGAKRQGDFDSKERKRQRMDRFASTTRKSSPVPIPSDGPVKGYLTALEKRYLRLTSEPDPALVRSEETLRRSLDFVCNKYHNSDAGYLYVNDQLKAIRQDLTVQHIENDLAVTVYETHGRIAIANDDLGEFNQCLSQLTHLYAKNKDSYSFCETYEFTCYRILYFVLTGNFAEVNKIRLSLLMTDKGKGTDDNDMAKKYKEKRMCMYKSLDLLTFIEQGNYHQFFKTFQQIKAVDTMKCASHLIDQFLITKQRLLAINTMCKAYKKLPKSYMRVELGFDDIEEQDSGQIRDANQRNEKGRETIEMFLSSHNLGQYLVGQDFDCSMAKQTVHGIVERGNFKKVDIKGQK